MEIQASRINFKTRRAHCDFCEQDIIFPRRHSTASPNAVIALNQAKEFFLSGDIRSAVASAQTAVEMVPKHVAALYIIAYYKAFATEVKSRVPLDTLFSETLPDAEFETEEEELFKELLLRTAPHSITYEEQILTKFTEYDDPAELAAFAERFCPYAIAKRINTEWFSPSMQTVYQNMTTIANVPKTWYALYQSLSKNPASPLSDNSFYLKTKSARFYQGYVLPIGQLLGKIGDPTLRTKFLSVFNNTKALYERRMKEAGA